MAWILSLDQGTTSSRAILFDHDGRIGAVAQREFEQIFPRPGWVEHDASEIWTTQIAVANEAVSNAGAANGDIAAIGITNQRETTVVWDRASGEPVCNAIVWQDRRTANRCDQLRSGGHAEMIREKTGLEVDAYFSASKLAWILDNVPGARARADRGDLAFGTIDTWLVWNLTNGRLHVTEPGNASRTMLFNILTGDWDDDLLELFAIPRSMLPEVGPSSGVYEGSSTAEAAWSAPIAGIAGDQQAALFGQLCLDRGMAKNTYGTGCFMLLNTGTTPSLSRHNLLTTIAWRFGDRIEYALEGSVFIGGAVVQWLRDGLGLIESSSEIEQLARTVDDSGGVYFVPALTGLGAPHWDQYARGTMLGLTRGTTRAHIARAALEGIAYQVGDVLDSMRNDSGLEIEELRVDGGAAANDLMLQFQADILGISIVRPTVTETTALGASYLAGLAVGFWSGLDDLRDNWTVDQHFEPTMSIDEAQSRRARWAEAIRRARNWESPAAPDA